MKPFGDYAQLLKTSCLTEQDIQEYINDMLNEKKEFLNEKEETPNHKARPSCMHRGSVSIRLIP